MRLTIDISDKDYNLFVSFADRLGATIYDDKNLRDKQLRENQITNTIKKGGDFSYLGDIIEWQKEQRKERDLPFKDL